MPLLIFYLYSLLALTPLLVSNRGVSPQEILANTPGTFKTTDSAFLYFAHRFEGVPYVGGTLDRDKEEKLVVNLQELDCTTYVETALALARCAMRGETTYDDYCRRLQEIRYIDGKVAYVNRKHYFTVWIEENVRQGIVEKVEPTSDDLRTGNHPFKAVQHLNVNYMSSHVSSYKMLSAHAEWLPGIKSMEQTMKGKTYRYIPRSALKPTATNNRILRKYIKDGDILVILTKKTGLDTSHIGIASWHSDGLHLLNASQVHKKVIDEPLTLYAYMLKHPSQLGIRVVRVK